jgi:2-methylcitrate dehydratase PrpD
VANGERPGMGSATEVLIDFALGLGIHDIPVDVRRYASRLIADTLAVTVAGASTDVGQRVTAYALRLSGGPTGRILGTSGSAPIRAAALANGTQSHALDLDDDEPLLMIGHPSAPVVAALVSISDETGCSGEEFVTAYVAAVEAEIAFGDLINPAHWWNGWHPTATIGTLGAVLACSRLAGLSEEETAHALAIAASSASGIRANFGTMTKPLHVGRSAEAAVLAIELAAQGFTGAADVLDGPLGLAAVLGAPEETLLIKRIRMLGAHWGMRTPGVSIKCYPSCSNTHPAIDAVLDLRASGALDEDPKRIVCRVAPGTEQILVYDNPTTALEAKFSLTYCVAVAARHGRVWLDDFTDEAVTDSSVRDLMGIVEVVLDPTLVRSSEGVTTSACVEVLHSDGRVQSTLRWHARGSVADPLSDNDLRDKFDACCQLVLGDTARPAFDRLIQLEREPSVADLLSFLTLTG